MHSRFTNSNNVALMCEALYNAGLHSMDQKRFQTALELKTKIMVSQRQSACLDEQNEVLGCHYQS